VQRQRAWGVVGNQISELAKRAGEIAVAIVRTTSFPKAGKAMAQIAGMLKREGRTVVVATPNGGACWHSKGSVPGTLRDLTSRHGRKDPSPSVNWSRFRRS